LQEVEEQELVLWLLVLQVMVVQDHLVELEEQDNLIQDLLQLELPIEVVAVVAVNTVEEQDLQVDQVLLLSECLHVLPCQQRQELIV
jgi:hypothetical protein